HPEAGVSCAPERAAERVYAAETQRATIVLEGGFRVPPQNQDDLSTTLRNERPAAKARQLSTMIWNRLSLRYGPCPAICGVSSTVGSVHSGCSLGSGSCSQTSRAPPATPPPPHAATQ